MAGLAASPRARAKHKLLAPGAIAGQSSATPGFRLVDVTNAAGIQFRHNSGAYGGKLLPETLGSGCAFLDYDARRLAGHAAYQWHGLAAAQAPAHHPAPLSQ